MAALEPHPELIQTIARITAPALAEQLRQTPAPFVLDVRSEKEWQTGHLPGSCNVPLTHLQERLADIPVDRPVVVHCEGGYRSAIGVSLLTAAGRQNVFDLVGGIKAWTASNLPVVTNATSQAVGETVCTR
jgi:rhodanese-related sulfurtransferase